VRWSAYGAKDPYSDVIVHEAANLLDYLKPERYGLHVRIGQERFVDFVFRHRELFAFACEAYSRVILQGDRGHGGILKLQLVKSRFGTAEPPAWAGIDRPITRSLP
jgi:hypothetical protein